MNENIDVHLLKPLITVLASYVKKYLEPKIKDNSISEFLWLFFQCIFEPKRSIDAKHRNEAETKSAGDSLNSKSDKSRKVRQVLRPPDACFTDLSFVTDYKQKSHSPQAPENIHPGSYGPVRKLKGRPYKTYLNFA